jgi:hypothetical protein
MLALVNVLSFMKLREQKIKIAYNNQIHLTVKSVTPFAIAKAPPLFTSSDLGVGQHRKVSSKYEVF